jgi:hypothetical protein
MRGTMRSDQQKPFKHFIQILANRDFRPAQARAKRPDG